MEVGTILIEKIDPPKNPMRFANDMEKIHELAQSIREVGIINPIIVAQKGNRFEIIAGNRRYLAAREAGLKAIPCRIWTHTQTSSTTITLTENIQRLDTSPLEEANTIQKLMENEGITQKQVAKLLGKSEAWVSQRLEILNWDQDLFQNVKYGTIPYSVAREIHAVKNEDLRYELLCMALQGSLTVEDVKAYVKAQETVERSTLNTEKETNASEKTLIERAQKAMEKERCECCGRTPGIAYLSYIPVCQECLKIIVEGKQ